MENMAEILFSKKEKLIFVISLISGTILHGAILFSNISYRDDVTYHYNLGETFASMRWSLGIFDSIKEFLQVGTFSINAWNGIWSLVWISLSAVFVVRLFDITDKILSILVGVSMVTFPVVTSTFAYMFTAHYYFFALFLMTFSVYLIEKYRKGWIAAIALISIGTGIYQAYFVYALAIMWAKSISDFWKSDDYKIKKSLIKYVVTLIGALILYFILSKVFILYQNVELNDYQGLGQKINEFSIYTLGNNLFKTYKAFFRLARWDVCGLSNCTSIRAAYLFLYIILALLAILLGWKNRRNLKKVIVWIGMLLLFPFSVSAIWILEYMGGAFVHTLMLYSYIIVIILPIALVGQMKAGIRITQFLCTILSITVIWITGYNGWLDNAAYEKAFHLQESANAYCIELISNIKFTDGYFDEIPILFVYDEQASDNTIESFWQYNEITLQGYKIRGNQFDAFATLPEYMSLHCGFKFNEPDDALELSDTEEVKNMPVYPDKGSIRIVRNVLVVKLTGIKQEL